MSKRKQSPRKTSIKKRRGRRKKRAAYRSWWRRGGILSLIGILCVVVYVLYLDFQVRHQFEGKRWRLPARIFARPLELYADKPITPESLIEELKLLRYQRRDRIDEPGEYRYRGNAIVLYTRGFPFADGDEPARIIRIRFANNRIKQIHDKSSANELSLLRLEPVPIAHIYPSHNEDRLLVQLDDVPPLLIWSLLTVEDRNFYDHRGLDPFAILRAALANIKAGKTVQGGSTITQQLVKNFFLSNTRTFGRKLNEAIMALLLEFHYSKDEILESYINEVYLGQKGQRAIHGFGLASQFYFERRLKALKPEQIVLLAAIIKGPSYYEPRKHPRRARQRRNLILAMLAEHGHLEAKEVTRLSARPLGVSKRAPSGITPFPAFVQFIRQQLTEDYRNEDLSSDGLVIFTTLDPLIQIKSETAIVGQLARLEKQHKLKQQLLQGAVVVTDIENGEVLALVGGRDPRFDGYNRALSARRPVGSLIKPAIYLTALSQPQDYNLTTRLDDAPLSIRLPADKVWSPQNYDRQHHGRVMLRDALVYSYNVSTARLGLSVGLDAVANNLGQLGLERHVPRYPSMLLGAVDMSPTEVSQIYQTLASGGYRAPLSTIREVMNADGVPLKRYPLKLEQTVDPAAVYLLTSAMQDVTTRGTAKRLRQLLPQDLRVAGKTGTTNGLRDSWFAGFSGKHLVVVWIGRDDNRTTGLSGATGALNVWADVMRSISTQPLDMVRPNNIEWILIDPISGLLADDACKGAEWIPFIKGTVPAKSASCARSLRGTDNKTFKWFEDLYDS